MDDTIVLTAVFIGGVLTGITNYLGLWLTVKKVADSRRPTLLVLSSMLLRIAACMAVFYLLIDSRWERLVLVLAGFYLARILACRRFGVSPVTSFSR
ncbi:N-ATPase subunit AtpR [Desulfocastanea catecholica]